MVKLTKEQLTEIKKQLEKQIENFPEEQKFSMKQQINEMSDDELEKFLEKNKLLNTEGQQSPFRLIVEGKIPTFKIAENDKALAVLEINPISKGHVIIISKIPYKTNEIPKEIQQFAQLMASHINQILQPKDVQIAINEMFGETIINILPIYNSETFESKRKKADEKELSELQTKLILPPEKSTTEVIKLQNEESSQVEESGKEKKRKTPVNRLPKAPKRSP